MFLYLEVNGKVSVYYAQRDSVFVYPIFIAITAVGRLVVLQSKEMAPENILIEAAAILLLSISAMVIIWATAVSTGRRNITILRHHHERVQRFRGRPPAKRFSRSAVQRVTGVRVRLPEPRAPGVGAPKAGSNLRPLHRPFAEPQAFQL